MNQIRSTFVAMLLVIVQINWLLIWKMINLLSKVNIIRLAMVNLFIVHLLDVLLFQKILKKILLNVILMKKDVWNYQRNVKMQLSSKNKIFQLALNNHHRLLLTIKFRKTVLKQIFIILTLFINYNLFFLL